MESMMFSAGVCILLTAFLLEERRRGFCFVQVEDEDIKIMGDSFSPRVSQEDSSELAAQQFLQQKESGNIDKARQLGMEYVQALLKCDPALFGGAGGEENAKGLHHRILLFSYALNRVVAEHSPDSILAQTTLNVFYNELENASPDLYQHVCDMAAFSLYILCERSETRTDEEIGKVYAGLCGEQDNPERIEEGNRLYNLYYGHCRTLREGIQFTAV